MPNQLFHTHGAHARRNDDVRDRGILDKLAAELTDWNRKLGEHARVANAVNKPFR